MCGIAGFWGQAFDSPKQAFLQLTAMADRLQHRGPDGQDVTYFTNELLGFCHRRLSIIGSDSVAHQPKASKSGRSLLTYNGEIYNFKELQKELEQEGVFASPSSDTDVLIEALEHWGIEKTIPKLNGMYAFALWDQKKQRLHLARDPMGIKPLYYGWQKGVFYFASELHAFRAIPQCELKPQPAAMMLLLKYNTISAPHSIYEGFYKCPPGHWLEVNDLKKAPSAPKKLLNAQCLQEQSRLEPFAGTFSQALDHGEALLRSSLHQHLISDVPLGAFLSGGIDSSLVCALAQSASSTRLKTFSIGFDDPQYNEAQHAKVIAQHLGTDHHELYLKPQEVIDAIPSILDHCDEPFADSSQVPTHFVSEMAKRHVTVALSGDGGDELFGGYSRYHWTKSIWSKLQMIPHPLKPLLGRTMTQLSPDQWDNIINKLPFGLGSSEQHWGRKIHKVSQLLQTQSPRELYSRLITHHRSPTSLMTEHDVELSTQHLSPDIWSQEFNIEESMMLLDQLTYLPDDILTKVDRASMSHSLEARVPLLTPDIVKFSWSLPLEWRQQKRFLKELTYRHIPKVLMDRPKMGFAIPLGAWLRGELRPWAEELLSTSALEQAGYLSSKPIQTMWQQHIDGSHNWEYRLWDILVLQHWLRRYH
jgi:asparagine synthase (glutamine-hydrolysing)